MNSSMTTTNELPQQLLRIGLRATSEGLDDLLARAVKQRWSPRQLLEEIARTETAEKAARNLERRLSAARLGRFKPLADFDWNWPKKIDQDLIEQWLRLEFIADKRNLILIGSNGLGKTLIVKNLAYQAALAGHTVLLRQASELISDLSCDSPQLRKRKLRDYGRVDLLCIDEVGYLAYDANAADLLYEVVNRRYEAGSIVITSNRAFKQWNEVFPNATSIGTMSRSFVTPRRRRFD
ncbi:MAG: ATP-binding protein [Acidobacteriota bacterium]|nr:MAG: ATP-binding protein [Acidobacteriota bacterium]